MAMRCPHFMALPFVLSAMARARTQESEVCQPGSSCTASLVQRDHVTRTAGATVAETRPSRPLPAQLPHGEAPAAPEPAVAPGAWLSLESEEFRARLSAAAGLLRGLRAAAASSWLSILMTAAMVLGLFFGGFYLLARVQKPAFGQPVQRDTWSFSQQRAATRAPRPSSQLGSQSSLPPSGVPEVLAVCEDLVVPVGTECVLFLPNLADATGQEVSVDDHRGVSVFKARFAKTPKQDSVRLSLLSPQDEVFCTLRQSLRPTTPGFAIFGPEGPQFGVLRQGSSGSFEVSAAGRTITMQKGAGERINVVDEDTRLMAMSEPVSSGGWSSAATNQRKVRVGPAVDAGLMVL